jgi:crooked neck
MIFRTFISNILFQSDEGWEEFFDYIFPEDEATKPNLKLLEMAKAWKRKKEKAEEEGEDEGKGTK